MIEIKMKIFIFILAIMCSGCAIGQGIIDTIDPWGKVYRDSRVEE